MPWNSVAAGGITARPAHLHRPLLAAVISAATLSACAAARVLAPALPACADVEPADTTGWRLVHVSAYAFLLPPAYQPDERSDYQAIDADGPLWRAGARSLGAMYGQPNGTLFDVVNLPAARDYSRCEATINGYPVTVASFRLDGKYHTQAISTPAGPSSNQWIFLFASAPDVEGQREAFRVLRTLRVP